MVQSVETMAGSKEQISSPTREQTVGHGLLRRYPVAAFAGIGIVLGTLLLPFQPALAQAVFVAVSIGGGLPLIYRTLKNMAQGLFTWTRWQPWRLSAASLWANGWRARWSF